MKNMIFILFSIFFSVQVAISYDVYWEEIMTGIDTTHETGNFIYFNMIDSKDNYLFVGTHKYGLYMSTDNGDNWTKTNFPLGLDITDFLVNNEVIFVSTSSGIYSSSDNGTSWVTAGLNTKYVPCLAKDSNNILYAGTWYYNSIFPDERDGRVHKSSDNGKTWKQTNETAEYASINDLAIDRGNLYASTYAFGLYLSTNQGETWSNRRIEIIDGDSIPYPSALYYTTNVVAIEDTVFVGTLSGLYFSTDYGLSWISRNKNYNFLVQALEIKDNYIFVGGGDGLFLSTNRGVDFKPQTDVLWHIQSIMIKDDYIFIGVIRVYHGDEKIYRRKMSTFFTDIKEKELESNANLFYPNPARDIINVSAYFGWEYQIYNLLGNSVKRGTITSENIDINTLSTGFYTIRFSNEGQQVVGMMIKE